LVVSLESAQELNLFWPLAQRLFDRFVLTKMHKNSFLDRALVAVGFDQLEVGSMLTALDASYVYRCLLSVVGIKINAHIVAQPMQVVNVALPVQYFWSAFFKDRRNGL
jgi:hypothetical protein